MKQKTKSESNLRGKSDIERERIKYETSEAFVSATDALISLEELKRDWECGLRIMNEHLDGDIASEPYLWLITPIMEGVSGMMTSLEVAQNKLLALSRNRDRYEKKSIRVSVLIKKQ